MRFFSLQSLAFLILFSSLSWSPLQAQKEQPIPARHYGFNGQYLDLATLQYEETLPSDSRSFKQASKYAARFQGLTLDRLIHQGVLFEIDSKQALHLKDLEGSSDQSIPNKEKDLPMESKSFLLPAADGVLQIKPLKEENGFMVYKYDKSGAELFGVQIPHSEFVQNGTYTYHLPYLSYKTHTASTVVFASYVDRIPKTVTLNSLDGKVANFDFSSIGIIRDQEYDMSVYGFIQLDKAKQQLNIRYVSELFSIERPYLMQMSYAESVLLDEQTLVLALYDGRAAGAHLIAINLVDKSVLWEKNVRALESNLNNNYFNILWLSSYEGKVLLEGYETEGRYLEVLDGKTGGSVWKSY